MNPIPQSPPDRRTLWFGAPGADDSKRSRDEIRIIKEMCNEEVETFLQINSIDTAAAKELRSEPPHIALAVLERGPLRACVNPSGALVARIRDAKRGLLGGSARYGTVAQPLATLDPNASEADKFLAENRIDQAGAASFRSESRDVQAAVMAKGPLINSTNPSASLMARIRTVRDNVRLGTPMPGVGVGAAPAGTPALMPPVVGQPMTQPLTQLMGQTQPTQPALALEDGRPADAAPAAGATQPSLNLAGEAMKAISKLNAQTAPAPVPPGFQGSTQPGAFSMGTANGGMQPLQQEPQPMDTEDMRLQDEALKAIQQLNAQDRAEL